MTRPTLLIAILLTGAMAWLASCSHEASTQASVMKTFYLNTWHTFSSSYGMIIYPATNYSTVTGSETASNDTLILSLTGSSTGVYPLGPTYSNDLTVRTHGKTYSSKNSGSYGSITISSLDANSLVGTGAFSATIFSPVQGDSLPVTLGTMSVKYQF